MLSTDRHPFLQHCLLWLVGGLVVLIAVMPASVLPLIGWDYALIHRPVRDFQIPQPR